MRNFARQSMKGGSCNASNQHYKSEISDEMLNIISKELDVNGNICEILGKYFEFLNKYEKLYAKEIDSKYDDYRDVIQIEKTDYVNKKLNMLSIRERLSKLDLIKTQMDFDATSSFSSAIWDEKSVYLNIENGFAFKPDMKDVIVEAFNNQTFNQVGDESAILRLKNYNPPDLIFQHLPVEEKVTNIEVNRMSSAYIFDTLTSTDGCEIVETSGKKIEIHAGIIYRETLKLNTFKKVI